MATSRKFDKPYKNYNDVMKPLKKASKSAISEAEEAAKKGSKALEKAKEALKKANELAAPLKSPTPTDLASQKKKITPFLETAKKELATHMAEIAKAQTAISGPSGASKKLEEMKPFLDYAIVFDGAKVSAIEVVGPDMMARDNMLRTVHSITLQLTELSKKKNQAQTDLTLLENRVMGKPIPAPAVGKENVGVTKEEVKKEVIPTVRVGGMFKPAPLPSAPIDESLDARIKKINNGIAKADGLLQAKLVKFGIDIESSMIALSELKKVKDSATLYSVVEKCIEEFKKVQTNIPETESLYGPLKSELKALLAELNSEIKKGDLPESIAKSYLDSVLALTHNCVLHDATYKKFSGVDEKAKAIYESFALMHVLLKQGAVGDVEKTQNEVIRQIGAINQQWGEMQVRMKSELVIDDNDIGAAVSPLIGQSGLFMDRMIQAFMPKKVDGEFSSVGVKEREEIKAAIPVLSAVGTPAHFKPVSAVAGRFSIVDLTQKPQSLGMK